MRKTALFIVILILAGVATAQTMIPLPAFARTYSSSMTRGFFCQVPADITVVGLRVPNETNHNNQNVCIYKHTAAPLRYPGTTPLTPLFSKFNEPAANIISCSVPYTTGDYLIVIGACGDSSRLHNSYSVSTGFATKIAGLSTTLLRCGIQANIITASTPHSVWSELSTVCRVEVYYVIPFTCDAPDKAGIGTAAKIDLKNGPATDFFQIAASLGNATTIPLGSCSIKLDVDPVFLTSILVGPPVFTGYSGTLVGGAGQGTFNIPNNSALVGIKVYHAGVSYSGTSVTDCTNTDVTELTT